MSNPMQDLHTLGLNPFAVTLLAESMLKSAYVKNCGTKPLTFEFPVRRGDCEGWAGVRITIEAVPASGVMAAHEPDDDAVLSLADHHAEESRADGRRVFERGGLIAFARELAAHGVPAVHGQTKPPADADGGKPG